MTDKNSQVAGVSPAGVSGGARQQNPPDLQVSIRKYGRNMGAKKLEWRYMYLYVSPFSDDDLETGVRKFVDAVNRLLSIWEPPFWHGVFRRDPWWMCKACLYCVRRMSDEVEKWRAGGRVRKLNMCMRHWAVYHFDDVVPYEPFGLLSDQSIHIVADSREIRLSVETADYRYNVRLDRYVAEMDVAYGERRYKFTYRNHLRGYPHNSSYAYILFNVYGLLKLFRNFLADNVRNRKLYSNVVINDVFTLSPGQPNDAPCGVCRL
jgi:hypothetical protein